MEKFKQTLKNRTKYVVMYNALVLIGISIGVFHPTAGVNDHMLGFMSGANVGMIIGIQFLCIILLTKYYSALKNEEKLKKLYIEETDERRQFIQTKIGGVAINIILLGLAAGVIIAGFYNYIVYFTLLSALIFTALVKGALKIYYNKAV